MTHHVTPNITDLEAALAAYIRILSDSAGRTRRAEDRPRYQGHLAAAAKMFGALRGERPIQDLKALVAAERHAYGWDYLSDDSGEQAEAAFHQFALFVEAL